MNQLINYTRFWGISSNNFLISTILVSFSLGIQYLIIPLFKVIDTIILYELKQNITLDILNDIPILLNHVVYRMESDEVIIILLFIIALHELIQKVRLTISKPSRENDSTLFFKHLLEVLNNLRNIYRIHNFLSFHSNIDTLYIFKALQVKKGGN